MMGTDKLRYFVRFRGDFALVCDNHPPGPKLIKLNLTNLTLDTQNDIRSIPFRVEVGNETESLSDRSY